MNNRIEEAIQEYNKKVAQNKERVSALMDKGDFLDDDGYPTEDSLEIIENWIWADYPGLLAFIRGIWHLASWGWHECDELDDFKEKQVHRYHISTAGWSGNEAIIRVLEKNYMFWAFTWVQSNRGGHYIFEVDEE